MDSHGNPSRHLTLSSWCRKSHPPAPIIPRKVQNGEGVPNATEGTLSSLMDSLDAPLAWCASRLVRSIKKSHYINTKTRVGNSSPPYEPQTTTRNQHHGIFFRIIIPLRGGLFKREFRHLCKGSQIPKNLKHLLLIKGRDLKFSVGFPSKKTPTNKNSF